MVLATLPPDAPLRHRATAARFCALTNSPPPVKARVRESADPTRWPTRATQRVPRILVLYHFLPPDDVVSAQIFGDLCEGLAARGWTVTARPCNRSCFEPHARHRLCETWRGVTIRRVWRPPLSQSSAIGRILNALWMTGAWSLEALRPEPMPDAVLVGTDPILSVFTLRVWKFFRPSVKRALWAFDLYPQAAVADGLLRTGSLAERVLSRIASAGVGAAHLVVDLGPCMRTLLDAAPNARRETLPPWALVESSAPLEADPVERRTLFGNARLGVLYSGTFGHAHSSAELLAVARRLRSTGIHFVFAVRGNREGDLRAAVTPEDENVSFAPFVSERDLPRRLGAADFHAVSLRPEWTGTVVPSKFQAALAAGRPLLFAGSPQAAPARWIAQYDLGFVLTAESIDAVAAGLLGFAEDPLSLAALRARCHETYKAQFSREKTLSAWGALLHDTALDRGQGPHSCPEQGGSTGVSRLDSAPSGVARVSSEWKPPVTPPPAVEDREKESGRPRV